PGLSLPGQQDRRRGAGRLVEPLPLQLARLRVERGDRTPLTVDGDDDAVADYEGRAAHAEPREVGLQLFERLNLPELLAAVGREAAQHARNAVGVDAPARDGRRRLRAGLEDAGVRAAVVGGPPQFLARLGVERDQLLAVLAGDPGVDEDLA